MPALKCKIVYKNHIWAGAGLLEKADATPVASVLKKPDPITTSFKDASVDNSLPESFGNDKKYTPLYQLSQNDEGGFKLCPTYP